MTRQLISKPQAANMFSVSVRTIERMLKHGELTKIKVRGCVRIPLAEVLNMLRKELHT
jgi:excisionase family DNA binding protein